MVYLLYAPNDLMIGVFKSENGAVARVKSFNALAKVTLGSGTNRREIRQEWDTGYVRAVQLYHVVQCPIQE
jgi:hypothetical protein